MMADVAKAQAASDGQSAGRRAAGRDPVAKGGYLRRIERQLPLEVVNELKLVAASTEKFTSKTITELDRRLAIANQYGVSKRRLNNYLVRLRSSVAGEGRSGSNSKAQPEESKDGWSEQVRAHRRRQASVGAILDQTFGHLAKCGPDLWERRAYLMLIGMVYERLATNEDEISTEDLVALAKILAENRRAEARLRVLAQPPEAGTPSTDRAGELPERFADVVRQVYGIGD